MKSSSSLPVRDLEQLSAYLDGQLNDAERRALLARLAHEPRLQQAFSELRQVREALRGLPQARPPRNFTLTPSMVGQTAPRVTRGLAYAWGSALASLAFVLLAVADLAGGGLLAARQAAPAAELQMAPALLAAPSEIEPRGAAADMTDQTASGMPPATATQIARETSILEPGVLAASATATPFSYAQEKSAGASETPCPAEFSSLRAMTLPPPESPTQGETVLGQTTETETLSPQPEAAAASSADAVPGRSSWLTPLRIIEAALAILALLLAAAAIRFRRLRR